MIVISGLILLKGKTGAARQPRNRSAASHPKHGNSRRGVLDSLRGGEMILLQLLLLGTSWVCADPIAKSSEEQVPLLELFSSEACSSCPPADLWLGKQAKHPKLWQSFVPIAFQVDYWNHLKWRDGLSSPEATERQKAYARAWGDDGTVYTPAFVYKGAEWRAWSDVTAPPVKTGPPIGRLTIENTKASGYRVVFKPKNGGTEDLTLHIALLGFGVRQSIGSGENTGRVLNHDFVVMDWKNKFVMRPVNDYFAAEFSALSAKMNPARQALVAWVQQGSAPKPLQATGAFLK